jgi:hypothetical protein
MTVGRWHTPAFPFALVLAVLACGEATAPTRSTTMCFSPADLWVGIQNDGQGWRTLTNAIGPVGVQMTERVVIARARSSGGVSLVTTLEFYYLSRSQAESTFTCRAGKNVHGLVTNIGQADTATASVALGGSSLGTNGPYTLTSVPIGPQDLVATHDSLAIIRRAQDYPDGSEVPALDFASSEVFHLKSNALSLSADGLPAQYWWTDLITQRGTRATLAYSFQRCCGTRMYSVPADRMQAGDMHHLYAVAGVDGDMRFVDRFYGAPVDQAVDMGPPANQPEFIIAKTQSTLWRVDLDAHAQYGRQVVIIAYDPQPQSITVIRATREHFGVTPATWSFTVPDLSRVPGFSFQQVTTPSTWEVTESGRPWLMPAGAQSGDTFLSAYKHN